MVKTVTEGTERCIQNGGWLSSWFSTERGIRQGCPLSALLFAVAVEILAIKITNNPEIKGTQIDEHRRDNTPKKSTKIKQFADDTTLTMKNVKDINIAITIVEQFKHFFSGLKLNRQHVEGI